jgi:hypothetical protein
LCGLRATGCAACVPCELAVLDAVQAGATAHRRANDEEGIGPVSFAFFLTCADPSPIPQLNIITGDVNAALAQHFTPENLERRLGGTSDYQFAYPPLDDLHTRMRQGRDPMAGAADAAATAAAAAADAPEFVDADDVLRIQTPDAAASAVDGMR